MSEPSNKEIMGAINELAVKIDGLDIAVVGLTTKVDGLDKVVVGLTTKVDGLDKVVVGLTTKVDGLSVKIDSNSEEIKSHSESIGSIFESIQALALHMDEQHAQTRSDLRSEINEGLVAVRSEMKEGFNSSKKELSDFRYSTEERFASVESMFCEEDKKIDRLTEKLLFRKVISKKDTKEVLALGPFPVQGAKTNSR